MRESALCMRDCWNWETGMTKDHVSKGVRVRVPYRALVELTMLALNYVIGVSARKTNSPTPW